MRIGCFTEVFSYHRQNKVFLVLCLGRKFGMLLNLVPQQKSSFQRKTFSVLHREREEINKWQVKCALMCTIWAVTRSQICNWWFTQNLQNQNQPVFPQIRPGCLQTGWMLRLLSNNRTTVKLTTRRHWYHNNTVLYSSVLSRAEVTSERKES